MPGIHNVFNASASIAVCMEEGLPMKAIKKGINEFSGVGRRYEKHNLSITLPKKDSY